MSRVLKRIAGGGTGGAFVSGDKFKLTPHVQPLKDDLDLLMLGMLGRNILAGGDLVTGVDASASGDLDLLNWTPLLLDNTSSQISSFSDTNGASIVVQMRFLLRVSNAGITLTPKVRYGSTITTITSVATISGTAACSATNSDFSGTAQYQTVAITLPSGVNLIKPQITIGGSPAAGYQAWARAWLDVFVQS